MNHGKNIIIRFFFISVRNVVSNTCVFYKEGMKNKKNNKKKTNDRDYNKNKKNKTENSNNNKKGKCVIKD